MIKEHLIDLEPDQLGLLEQILKRHIPNKTVWAYGSRVTWKANERSDLDLAVFDCNSMETGALREALEESNLLVSVDVMKWESIPENFKKNIREKYVVLQEKMKLEGWREVKLEEVASEIKSGGTPLTKQSEYYGGNIPWLNTKEINFNRIFDTETKITEYGFENSSAKWVKENSVVVAMYGATAGKIALTKIALTTNQACCNLTLDENQANYLYIYYNLFSRYSELVKLSSGAAQQNLNVGFIANLTVLLPPLPEQKAIAEVLSSLDDKIDLLHRQNKTLEDIAQTLFRKWFINEANEEWEIGRLDDVVEIFDSKRVPLSKMQREKKKEGKLYPYYGAAQIMDYVNDYIFDGEYVLMAEDGTVKTDQGYPILQYASSKFWVNNHTHILKAKKPYENIFLWHFLLRLNIERYITGAVQPKINQANLMSIKFPKYPAELILKFQETTRPTFDKILKNKSSIYTLENLRDTLLPKLMSGNVRVEN